MTVYEAVKDSLDIVQVARDYGVRVVGRSKAHCPFHDDRSPSMSFWSNNRKFTCFGACDISGDVIDLVGRLENLEPLEAARWLNDRYHLRLDFDKPADRAELRRRHSLHERRMALERWEQEAYRTLAEYSRLLYDWRSIYVPLHPDLPISPRYVEAAGSNRDYVYYLMDEMIERKGNLQAMAEFYMAQREYIEKLQRRLKEEKSPNVGRVNEDPAPITGHGAIYLPAPELAVRAL